MEVVNEEAVLKKQILERKRKSIQIQIKNHLGRSKSFTIKDITIEEAYNRVEFLFEQLSKQEGEITIVHYNKSK